MSVVQLFTKAFHSQRDPRSDEYKAGCLAALRYRAGEADSMTCPYPAGTARADAWYAGTDEGHAIWRDVERARGE